VDPDRELVEDAARGSREAFDALVRRHQGAIVNLARAMTAADADADDLAQEAFVRAWRSLARFRHDSTFRTWLHGIAINVIRTHRGRGSRLRRLFGLAESGRDGAADPLDRASIDDGVEGPLAMREIIDRALATLPPDMREAVVLRDVQGLDYKEIAAALGVPLGTVESRIFRARQRLRPLLEPLRDRAR
jgi:RNA polymerase sigma-70 factor (ECF subfamily)